WWDASKRFDRMAAVPSVARGCRATTLRHRGAHRAARRSSHAGTGTRAGPVGERWSKRLGAPAPRSMAGLPPFRTPRPSAPLPRLTALPGESGSGTRGVIGAGGVGISYSAHDAVGNVVAIKLLRHEISDDARARERMARQL